MSEPAVEPLRTLSDACPRLSCLLLQGSSLGCHVFENILRKIRTQRSLALRFEVRVEQVTHEPDRDENHEEDPDED
jgi:hypothetical protein